jgi:hypothetical protein
MSAVAPLLKPLGLRPSAGHAATRPAARSRRPRLVLVAPNRSTAGRLPFALLIGAVLVTGLLTLLMLHTLAAQDGFTVTKLQDRQKALIDQEQSLEQTVQSDSSPASLRARATALGMVPSVVNSYHRMRDGRAIGLETPVIPAPAPVTTAKVSAASTAAKSATTHTKTTAAANGTAGTASRTAKPGTTKPAGTAKAGAKPATTTPATTGHRTHPHR